MPTLQEIRSQYPQYGDMTDAALADALYKKHYTDIPRADFDKKIGLTKEPTVGVATALGRGAAQGATANFYDELRGLMEAGGLDPKEPASLLKLVQGAYQYFTGDQEAAGRYEAGAKRVRGELEAARRDQPIATVGGELAGGLALPVGAAASAATLPGRMAAGAGVGAGYGALSGAGAGTDVASRATGAAIGAPVGAVTGAALPAVVSGVGRVAQPILSNIRGARNPAGEAARRAGGAVARDMEAGGGGLTPNEFIRARDAGAPVAVADIGGETTRALVRASANTSPVARATIEKFANDRFEGQTDRAVDFLNGLVGGRTNRTAEKEALQVASRAANSPAYEKAYTAGDKPIWSSELERLSGSPTVRNAMKGAENNWRDWQILDGYGAMNPGAMLNEARGQIVFTGSNGQPTFPNIQYWDYTARNLAGLAQAARTAGNKTEATRYGGLEKAIKAQLDKLVPEYGAARSTAKGFFASDNALENGAEFVTTRAPIDEARKAIGSLSAPDRELFRLGYVSELVNKVSRTGDRLNVINKIGQSKDAQERLAIALGPDGAKQVQAFLHIETAMDKLRTALGNSTTTRQLVELGLAGSAAGAESYLAGTDTKTAATALLAYGLARGQRSVDSKVVNKVAEILTSNDPTRLLEGVKMVAKSEALQKRIRAIATHGLGPIAQGASAMGNMILGSQPLRLTVRPSDKDRMEAR